MKEMAATLDSDSLEVSIIDSLIRENNLADSIIQLNTETIDSLIAHSLYLRDSLSSISNEIPDQNSDAEIFGMPISFARILIPVVVTVSIFALGQFIVWFKSKYEKRNEVDSYRKLILGWVGLMENAIEQQITSCNDFSERLRDSQDIHPERFQYNKLLANKVDDFSVDIYVNTFVTNAEILGEGMGGEKEKWCFNLISQFNFITNIEQQIPSIYEKYQTQTFEIMDEWNDNFSKIDSLISEQSRLVNINKTHATDTFHASIMGLVNSWLDSAPNGRSSVTLTMNNLINPMTDLVRIELRENPSNDYAFNLSDNLQTLRISHLKWDTSRTGNVQVFEDLGLRIKEGLENLQQTRDDFQNRTRVSNLFRIK